VTRRLHLMHFSLFVPFPHRRQRTAIIDAPFRPHFAQSSFLRPREHRSQRRAIMVEPLAPHLIQSSDLIPEPHLLHITAIAIRTPLKLNYTIITLFYGTKLDDGT
jgi:hypothetical protein